MVAFKVLHILLMFGTVTMFIGGEAVLYGAVRARDVAAIRRIAHITERNDIIGVVMFLLGIGAGLATAATGNFDFTKPWLIIAYVLVAGLLIAGGTFFSPRAKKLVAAADASPTEAPSPELDALIDVKQWATILVVDVMVWATIVYLMVAKPFS